MRTRTRPYFWEYETILSSGSVSIITYEGPAEIFVESAYPGSNQCYHKRVYPLMGRVPWQFDGSTKTFVTSATVDLTDSRALNFINSASGTLSWDKVPTSSKFGIIQILAELDESIRVFTLKFWNSLSYGSFTWGVLPLVSDINSILATLQRVISLDDMIAYEDVKIDSASFPVIGLGTQASNLKVTTRFSGKVKLDFSNLPGFLDIIGFHPDVATAWDLIPLSFLVDYLIPVGNFLDGLSNSGWVDRVYFEGWQTTKVEATYSSVEFTRGAPVHWIGPSGVPLCGLEMFSRVRLAESLPVEKRLKDLGPEVPSLNELFNIFYVLVLSKR